MDKNAHILSQPAVAPTWMFENSSPTDNQNPLNQTIESTEDSLHQLANHCPVFARDWQTQREQGLHEEDWFKWSSLLVKSGLAETAQEFSRASIKHNQQSTQRIISLTTDAKKGMTRCTTFGCSEDQIKSCFHNKINCNEQRQITNSPGAFLKQGSKQFDLTSVGFILNKDTGLPTNLNHNTFARHVVNDNLDIVYVKNSNNFYLYSSGFWKQVKDNELKRHMFNILNSYVLDFWSPAIEDKYMQALALIAPAVDQMDANRRFLNLENGMLDLNDFALHPHSKEYFSTIRIPITFNQEAECPTFDSFLHQIFDGDRERISLVQEMFGYCLTVEVIAQKAFILYGKGANGKSVLADILSTLVGPENTCALTLNDLEKSFARSELVDKQLLLSTENETDSRGINTQFLKAITSGDEIRVERKHEQGFTYRPFCKVVLGMNNLPQSRDKSFAYMRRLIIIPFQRTFSKDQADVHLTDKLKKELPGILNFALKGLDRLRRNEFIFTESTVAENELKNYREDINPIEIFVEENFEKGTPVDRVPNHEIMSRYRKWSSVNGYPYPMSNQRLMSAIRSILENKGITAKAFKTGGNRCHTGIKLKNPSGDDPKEDDKEMDIFD